MMGAMGVNRRSFLRQSLLAAAALQTVDAKPRARGVKNWAWIPTNTRPTADQWKLRFEKLRAAGIQAILPEVYAGREAFYASSHLPVKQDWLGQILPLAKAAGLEVHAWMWSMPCMNPEILKAHPDWYNVNAKGESAATKPAYVPYYKFLDPGRPEVREWVQGTVKELASIPDLTGVHLDYIRHPDAILPSGLWKKYNIVQDHVFPEYDYGYSEYERGEFKKKYGADPMQKMDAKLDQKWFQFRLDMVTGLVNGYLVPAAHAAKKQITAAVFPGPSLARINVRQDWGRWKLDAFLPMIYHSFYQETPAWVGRMTREGVGAVKAPLYSGLFLGGMKEDEFSEAVRESLQAGAAGVSIFAENGLTDARLQVLKSVSEKART